MLLRLRTQHLPISEYVDHGASFHSCKSNYVHLIFFEKDVHLMVILWPYKDLMQVKPLNQCLFAFISLSLFSDFSLMS